MFPDRSDFQEAREHKHHPKTNFIKRNTRRFFLTCKVEGNSKNTIECYRYSVTPFTKSLNVLPQFTGNRSNKKVYLYFTGKWMKKRGYFPYEDKVFITRQGYGLKKRGLSQIIERLAGKAHIQGVRCSAHTLRHTFATNFIRNGGDVFSLQKILGHSDIQTCMI